MGPLVPSDTVRRYQHVVGSAWANAATVLGGVLVTATRVVRGSPLEVEVCVVVASGWSQHRVSAAVATNATVPTQASHAAQKSGLLPYRQSATIYLNGSISAWWSAWTIAAANWGLLCHTTSSGSLHLARRAWYASVNHGSGMKSRLSTNA